MGQSLSKIYVHVTFSTKGRRRWLQEPARRELHRYFMTVLANLDASPVSVGGTEDHVHLLCVLPRTLSIAQLVEKAKTPTSRWMKTKTGAYAGFGWQSGYGAFSVSASHVDLVRNYIHGQEGHHRKRTFQEEFRRILTLYEVEWDERYVWD